MRHHVLVRVAVFVVIVAALVGAAHQLTPGRAATVTQQQQMWVWLRGALPAALPVVRPRWLPPAFRTAGTGGNVVGSNNVASWNYEVFYCGGSDCQAGPSLTFRLLGATDTRDDAWRHPDWRFPVQVGTLRGAMLLVRSHPPELIVEWRLAGRTYLMQAHGVGMSDVLRIAADVRPWTVRRP